MNISRREFLSGAVACGAFYRVFGDVAEKPILTVGIVSDPHCTGRCNQAYFNKVLEYFRDLSVDAVAIPGDFGNVALKGELLKASRIWFKVFPNDRLPNGARVERLFVTGNHDVDGWSYPSAKGRYADAGGTAEELGFYFHAKEFWREAWHEEYEPVMMKTVKGYTFVLRNWIPRRDYANNPLRPWLAEHGGELPREKPFFYLQHEQPWGGCNAASTAFYGDDCDRTMIPLLSPYPNVIALTGHIHQPLTDETTVVQNGVTSVNCGSTCAHPFYGPKHENARNYGKEMPPVDDRFVRHFMVMRVYGDRVVLERRCAVNDERLGADFVIPIGSANEGPFVTDRRTAVLPLPQFAAGAVASVAASAGPDRAGDVHRQITVSFPTVNGLAAPHVRAFDYEVTPELRLSDGKIESQSPSYVLSPCIGFAPHRDTANSCCIFAAKKFAKASAVRFHIRPRDGYLRSGEAICSDWFDLVAINGRGRSLFRSMRRAAFAALGLVVGWAGPASAARVKPEHKAAMDPLRIEVKSTFDGSMQPCYYFAPEHAKTNAVPLLIGLHTWSGDIGQYHHYIGPYQQAKRRGWAFVGSGFRGPNWTPNACGGDAAVQDIVDAIEYAKAHAKIDASRIYIVGASGGGHMALLMAGRHPEIFAGVAAFCPPADLTRWHRQLTSIDRLGKYKYARHMEQACGGTPAEKPDEYARRSSTTHLTAARQAGIAIYIETGIHDGWAGSVPCGHAVRSFNLLADEKDRIAEEDIAFMEANQAVPDQLKFAGRNPFYGEKNAVLLRRTSANAVLTIFNGGHGGNWPAAYDFIARQQKGKPADFTVPKKAKGKIEALYK